jgi:hypothetical protein
MLKEIIAARANRVHFTFLGGRFPALNPNLNLNLVRAVGLRLGLRLRGAAQESEMHPIESYPALSFW